MSALQDLEQLGHRQAMEVSFIESLVDLMRRKGVSVLEHKGTKILLGAEPVSDAVGELRTQAFRAARKQGLDAPLDVSPSVQAARDMEVPGRELTDDEILFASSQGWPEGT